VVDRESDLNQFLSKFGAPGAGGIKFNIKDALVIRGDLYAFLIQCTDTAPRESPQEIAEFKYHILTCATSQICRRSRQAPNIVCCKQDYCKTDIRKNLKLLDDGASRVGLFVKDNGFESEALKESSNRLFCLDVPSVDNKHTLGKLSG